MAKNNTPKTRERAESMLSKCAAPRHTSSGTTIRNVATSSEIFKALAHPSRLRIIEALADGKRCVQDLTAVVGSDMSTVSRHLAKLRACGIIRDEKQGLQVFYEVRCRCVLDFLACVEALIAERTQTECACRK